MPQNNSQEFNLDVVLSEAGLRTLRSQIIEECEDYLQNAIEVVQEKFREAGVPKRTVNNVTERFLTDLMRAKLYPQTRPKRPRQYRRKQ